MGYDILKAVEFGELSAQVRKRFSDEQALAEAGWWLQKKYDGCMGLAVLDVTGGDRMLSRTGENYTASTRHLLDELREAGFEECIVIGEVWEPHAGFPTISGHYRRRMPSPHLCFVANDVIPLARQTDTPYHLRFAQLASLLSDSEVFQTRVAHTIPCAAGVDVQATALEWQGEGAYDGAILRDPTAGYQVGTARQGQIVKVKPTLSLDLRVMGTTPGIGKHAGKIGALVVRLPGGATCSVGTGLSDADRAVPERMWYGQIVAVEAMSMSTEGKLREPRLKGVRYDKLRADGE